ncbi:aldose 1-epimerase [Halomonas salifodinae]|uniref:aldose 1-epimerase n=1 Tax=Halomonas salifodinae TaxID=438745 RepID=UPI0033BE845B
MPLLRHGDLEAGLAPACGGAFTHLRWKGQELLRPLLGEPEPLPEGPRHSGGYVLAPYSNRIAEATFPWQGEGVSLRRNFGDHPHSLHGFAWQRPWACRNAGQHHATLVLNHPGDEDWPWRCLVYQEVRLGPAALSLSLGLVNRDIRAMPAGLGWHPYFHRTPEVRLGFAAEALWLNDNRQLPQHRVSPPEAWDFRRTRRLGWPGLDHCYAGWSRRALIHWPEYRLRLHLAAGEGLDHLVLFTPEGRDFFALEPVSHANAALNMVESRAQGIRSLAPGESLTCHLQLTLEEDHG